MAGFTKSPFPHRSPGRPPSRPAGTFSPCGQPHDLAVKAERCRRSFYEYIKEFWDEIDPSPFIPARHIGAIAEHLQAVTERQIHKLVVNICPGAAKSLLTSVLWPSWEWCHTPTAQSLFLSYDPLISTRDASKCRVLIESEKYQDIFNPDWRFRQDQNQKTYYVNTRSGSRYSYGLLSRKITGWRGDKVVIDDPLSTKDRFNAEMKAQVIDVLDSTIMSRFNDRQKGVIVIIMQRLAENDLSGHVKKKIEESIRKHESPDWEFLKLPSEFKSASRCQTSIGWTDWRKDNGELLFPELFPASEIHKIKTVDLSENDYAAQHDQEPAPESGARFRRSWFQYWEYADASCHTIRLYHRGRDPEVIPLSTLWFFASCDAAVGEKKPNDFTVYLIYGVTRDSRVLLIDRYKDRMSEPVSINLAVDLWRTRRFGGHAISYFAVEQNGIGLPLIQNMRAKGIPVVGIKVHKDKESMSTSAIVKYNSFQVYHPIDAEWKVDYENNLVLFPFGEHDDDISSVSIGITSLAGGIGMIEASESLRPNGRMEDRQPKERGGIVGVTERGRKMYGLQK